MKTLCCIIAIAGACVATAGEDGFKPLYQVTGTPQGIRDRAFAAHVAGLAASRRIDQVIHCIELVEYAEDPWSSNEARTVEELIPALGALAGNYDSSIVPLVCFRCAQVSDKLLRNRYLLLINKLCGGQPESYFKQLEPEGMRALLPQVAASTSFDRPDLFPPPGAAAASALDAALERLQRKEK